MAEKGFWLPAIVRDGQTVKKLGEEGIEFFIGRAFLDILKTGPAGVQLGSGPNSGQKRQAE